MRAPRRHGAVESAPALSELVSTVAANRRLFQISNSLKLLGRTWGDLRRRSAVAACSAAAEYFEEAGQPLTLPPTQSLLIAGHQPELFHPGVWVKNFALHGLARAAQATPLNLVIDNDTVKTTSLRLPVFGEDLKEPWLRVAAIPFDHSAGETPFEEYDVHEESTFASLAAQALTCFRGWGFEPFLETFWAVVREKSARTKKLGERFAAARRHFERAWGCSNLEIPISALCRTEPFAWFACQVLVELPRFHADYNQCLDAYRQKYGLRSRSHPAPNLAVEGDWLEAPFWSWTHGQTRRGRLFARLLPDRLELRSGSSAWPTLPRPRAGDASSFVRCYQELERQGLVIRSRALVNTLFARLFLGEFFLHGIGGGKYDEVTDQLIRAFYWTEPPHYGMLTATLLLPFTHWPATPDDVRRLARRRRDLRYNPERYLSAAARQEVQIAHWLDEKESWRRAAPARATEKKQRFQAIRAVNENLAMQLTAAEVESNLQLTRAEREVDSNAVLDRRDYAFCLYPEEMLRTFMRQFLDIA
jgi:hypothetical protein